MKRIILLLATLWCLFSSNAGATVFYVDSSHVGGTQTGTSWATAFSNFQNGIDAASAGDSVWVAKGTYTAPLNGSFVMKEAVKIFGGFMNTYSTFDQRNWQGNVTTLQLNSGNGSLNTKSVILNDNNNLTPASLIDGFTLTQGTLTNSFSGRGMYNNYASPTVSNCIFANNYIYGTSSVAPVGAGMCNINASPVIVHCSFSNNTVVSFLSNTTPNSGSAIYNGSQSAPVIEGCQFSQNNTGTYQGGFGGAVFCGNSTIHTTINNCVFVNNTSGTGWGGAIVCKNAAAIISNTRFQGNYGYNGGALYLQGGFLTDTIRNCSFIQNHSTNGYAGSGGAIYLDQDAKGHIVNTLFVRNTGADEGAISASNNGGKLWVADCTFWGCGVIATTFCQTFISNTIISGGTQPAGIVITSSGSSVVTSYSMIKGMTANAVNHNINGSLYPQFADTANGNFQLLASSPCINVGRNDSIPPGITTDLANHARINDGTVDMGAYEYGIYPPLVNLGNDTAFCAGNTLTLNAQNIGTTYLWNTGATTQTINVTASGTYYVTATNTAGSSSDTIVVMVNPLPVVDLGNDTVLCDGSVTSLTLNAQNPGSTYLWKGNSTAQTFNVTTGGTYYVSVTNAYQCNKKDTIVIALGTTPTVNLGNDTTLCAGSLLNAQNPGSTYLWSNNATTQTAAVTTSGIYAVTVTGANLCKGRDTINVTVNPLPVVNLGNDTSFCAGNSITLNAQNPGASYLWVTGDTTQSITVTPPGTGSRFYSVIVTGDNHCKGRDTIKVSINAVPVVNLGNDTTLCAGSSKTLNAQNAGFTTYLWSNGATTQTISVNTTGTYYVTVTTYAYFCKRSDTIQVTVRPLPVVNLGADTAFCAGSTLTLNAGNPGANYLWSTGTTLQTINVNTPGTYSVLVTDTLQCKKKDTIQVGVNANPVVNLGHDTAFCTGNALVLNAQNNGAAYLWNNNSTAQTLSATTTGTYSVSVTDVHQCKGSDTIAITVNPSPVVNLGNDTAICGTAVALTLDAQNPGAAYVWNNSSTAQALNVATAGTYYVSVTNAYQCNKKDTIVVTAGTNPVVNLGNDTAFCAGNTLTLNAQNPGVTYLWSNAATTQTTGVNASGTYYVTVIAPSQCKGSDTIHVTVNTLPALGLGNDTAFCAGNNLLLNAQNAGATYLWSNAATTQTINANTTGTYYVTVTGTNQCKSADTIQITVNPLPEVHLGSDTLICIGSTLILDAQNAGAVYLWDNNSTSQFLNIIAAGTYYVDVTDANACKSSDTIQVSVAALPVVDLGNDTTFCAANGFELDAQHSGATYLWSTTETTQTISVNATGSYEVEVTDINGCKGRDTIEVIANPSPVVSLGNDVTTSLASYSIDAGNAGATYLWSNGATTQTITVTTNGTYGVTVTNTDGCSAADTIVVTFEATGTGIKDVNDRHDVKVMPNPAKEMVYIQTDGHNLLGQTATLTDAFGRTIRTVIIKSKTQELSLAGLAQGLYYLKIQAAGTVKIVKE